jgi:hypothetical protein
MHPDLPHLGLLLQWGWTPLHRAAWSGHKEVVRQLLRAGATVEAVEKVIPSPQAPQHQPTEAAFLWSAKTCHI